MSRRGFQRLVMAVGFLVTAAVAASAQTVVYDWNSNEEVPESYPRIIRRETVTFRIRNVNDILYTYKLEITQTPITGEDFEKIAGLLNRVPGGGPRTALAGNCQGLELNARSLTRTALDAINKDPKLPVGYAATSPHVSIPVEQSIAAWKSHLADVNEALDAIEEYRQGCSAQLDQRLNDSFGEFERTVRDLDAKVKQPHVFEDTHVIDPGNNVTAKVIEKVGEEVIKTKTFEFPGVDVLTLSAGALFSRIPDRTYEARKSPGSELNLLTVEGNSRATPNLVGLLNYSLGSIGLDHNNAGLALSAGPVLKLGNQSESSSFGFFAGVSGHLYHRFYITPGIHFGQFADFPVGFANGSPVPENFGELTPVKRWTGRFGLAITFKAKDFSNLGSDKPKVTGTEAGDDKDKSSSNSSASADLRAGVTNRAGTSSSVAATFLRPPTLPAPPQTSTELRERRPETVRQIEVTPASAPLPSVAGPELRHVVSVTSSTAITHVTSITNTPAEAREQVVLNAVVPIREYRAYFRRGRFFISLPHASLDELQDDLAGQSFTDPVFEQRGDEFVVSFAVSPGIKVRVQEQAKGLAVIFFSPANN
jgi:hypothetical protein